MEATTTLLDQDDSIGLSIPADGRWAGLLRLTVAGIGAELDLSTELIDDLKLAVTEASRHMIGLSEAGGRLSVQFMAQPTEVRFTVTLDGVRDPSAEAREDGDVSLFVLRAIADDIQIQTAAPYTLVVRKAT